MGAGTGTQAAVLAGNYITAADVDNWPGTYGDTEKADVIARMEELVEKITGDLFYQADFDVYVDGNGKDRLNVHLKPDILTVTAINISGVSLSSDYWTYDDTFVYRDPEAVTSEVELRWLMKQFKTTGLFPAGIKNVEIIGTYGWATTPENIKQAMIILCKDDNDPTEYSHVMQGSEQIGGYQYQYEDRVLTGVYEADILLEQFIKRKAMLSVV